MPQALSPNTANSPTLDALLYHISCNADGDPSSKAHEKALPNVMTDLDGVYRTVFLTNCTFATIIRMLFVNSMLTYHNLFEAPYEYPLPQFHKSLPMLNVEGAVSGQKDGISATTSMERMRAEKERVEDGFI